MSVIPDLIVGVNVRRYITCSAVAQPMLPDLQGNPQIVHERCIPVAKCV
jgi:hypothetical protein